MGTPNHSVNKRELKRIILVSHQEEFVAASYNGYTIEA